MNDCHILERENRPTKLKERKSEPIGVIFLETTVFHFNDHYALQLSRKLNNEQKVVKF